MTWLARIRRHLRLSRHASADGRDGGEVATPPFLILFVNSTCNLRCDHCFYWKELNQKTDLELHEFVALSESLGPIENLNLSGGEPFIHKEFAEICRTFVRNNGARRIYCPTNGWFTENTVKQLRSLFEEEDLDEFTIELSLDGTPSYHDKLRGIPTSFRRAIETYDALAEYMEEEPRLQVHANSTCAGENVDEIRRLTTFLYERCPKMGHHNIAMLRGERKRPTLMGPDLDAYRSLIEYVARLWSDREHGRPGGLVEPMLHWGKLEIARAQDQAIPCRAGVLSGVVYANGDVSVCEQLPPIGNIREKPFPEIWNAANTREVRADVRAKKCFCTNEIFLWSSIVFQPRQLLRAFLGSRAWKKKRPLGPGEVVDYKKSAES